MRHLTLMDDGDSFESESPYTQDILDEFSEYEAFWRAHIVPLTYRATQTPRNKFVRPNPSKSLNRLVDSNYAVFYHLTFCQIWRHKSARADR